MTLEPGKRKLNLGGGAGNTMIWTSPASGKQYNFRLLHMDSDQISSQLKKSIYNQRGKEGELNPALVSDILPSIERDAGNSVPGYVVGSNDGVGRIVVGYRRSYAVSLCKGAKFAYWYVDDMETTDIRHLAGVADLQRKQTVGDRIFALQELEESLGARMDNDEVASFWGVSDRYVRAIRIFQSLPVEMYDLFPFRGAVSYRFLQDVSRLTKSPDEILEKIADIEPLDKSVMDEDELRNQVKSLQAAIINALKKKSKTRAKPSLPRDWAFDVQQGVKVKAKSKTRMTIDVDLTKLPEDVADALKRALEK
ncbi:MAG: hypothetical protein CMF12_04040 [Idiomarina sp.]|uniref:hypothetical protein n=1 Tax=Idiomarina sp. TaxID=1874361 RepID=UPI000C544DA3|nr:hypothetical protein [Idiomarina sp.]MBT41674.1 hypothetical protein [Idiomarina sp.]